LSQQLKNEFIYELAMYLLIRVDVRAGYADLADGRATLDDWDARKFKLRVFCKMAPDFLLHIGRPSFIVVRHDIADASNRERDPQQ
jgi:hypothetical protein